MAVMAPEKKPVRDVRQRALVAELQGRIAELEALLAAAPAPKKRAAAKPRVKRPKAGSVALIMWKQEQRMIAAGCTPEEIEAEMTKRKNWKPSVTVGLEVKTVSELEENEKRLEAEGKITPAMRTQYLKGKMA